MILQRILRSGPLILYFLKELILSAIAVSALVLTPNLKKRLRPGLVSYPLTVLSDAEITLLANMITLTPGTLSVDISDDKKTLLIHALDLESADQLIGQIAGGFEAKILQVFR